MLVSDKELKNLKLRSIKIGDLKDLAKSNNLTVFNNGPDTIKELMKLDHRIIDKFIKNKYKEKVRERQGLISNTDLVSELKKVTDLTWGAVQGQLDQRIQVEYVRRYYRYDDLLANVKKTLHNTITSYVMATWYNHWSTVLIEDYTSIHPRVIPTLKNNFGIDIFFDNQPFDLKTTYLPKNFSMEKAIEDPKSLAVWMYENQGAQRFGDDNRLFIVLIDTKNPSESWKLKREVEFVNKKIDHFFDASNVTADDEIIFSFQNRTYTAIAKVLLITK